MILGLKPYVTPCLSHVLRTFCDSWVETLCDSLFESCPGTFCDSFSESWVETLCDSLFESCPRGPSVIQGLCLAWFETLCDSLIV